MEILEAKDIKRIAMNNGIQIEEADSHLLQEAWYTARRNLGNQITFYLPGMIRIGGIRGKYPAISITGNNCQLMCRHCKGLLLGPMLKVQNGDELLELGAKVKDRAYGVLLSGGADRDGRLPWQGFLGAIERMVLDLGLNVTAHTGFVDQDQAQDLRLAGVSQGLLDLMGDPQVVRDVYGLESLKSVTKSYEAICVSGMEFVPHIVAGLYFGRISGEYKALDLLKDLNASSLVIVTLNPLKGTDMAGLMPPPPLEVARLIARARLLFKGLPISLGCERPRGRYSRDLECLALLAGVDRISVWSDSTEMLARELGLEVACQLTCCSLAAMPSLFEPSPWS